MFVWLFIGALALCASAVALADGMAFCNRSTNISDQDKD
jgi:hypothetical protein